MNSLYCHENESTTIDDYMSGIPSNPLQHSFIDSDTNQNGPSDADFTHSLNPSRKDTLLADE